MKVSDIDRLREIKTFPSLVKYLREELGWPIESDDIEEITYDWSAEELSLDAANAAKIESIQQLIPLSSQQPWGIFFIKFERKRLPIVALRLILGRLVLKRRDSARRADQPAWHCNDLLFISAYGDHDERRISLAHFAEDEQLSARPTLRVLGWKGQDTNLHLDHVADELRTKLRWAEDEEDLESWRKRWSEAFVLGPGEVIQTSKELAVRLADLARRIRKDANDVLRIESERGPLRRLHKAFQESLIHDLSEDGFADMYAQTVAYGLLAARVSRPAGVIADNLADMVPDTNAFLREMLSTFLTVGEKKRAIDFDELGIQDVVDLLNSPDTHMEDILRDFGHRTQREDPVMHFYELFLKEYDRKKKVKRGVFYTPKPVVSFIVRSVDEILHTEFGLEDGLADTTTWGEMAKRHKELTIPEHAKPSDPFVQILDPAAGTGTFLVEVIDIIHQTMTEKWKAEGHMELEFGNLWNEYVPKHLLPRLHGFELMMAPYTIAHMKISLKLFETGYRFRSEERVRVFLTNSLEPSQDFSDTFEQMTPALAHEAQAANQVKTETPITVVIGNPPYAGHSANASTDRQGKPTFIGQLMKSYFKVDGQPLNERNPKWLQDDYVKFIRYAQWRINSLPCGVLAYVTNHSYLDNPTFRGMRQQLTMSFPCISILDLHGSTKRKERARDGSSDKNVFEIQQGVAVGIYRRSISRQARRLDVVRADLYGSQKKKCKFLVDNTHSSVGSKRINPESPHYMFSALDRSLAGEYEPQWGVSQLFCVSSVGVVTGQDENTIADSLASAYLLADRYGLPQKVIQSVLYRPFDLRYIVYSQSVVTRPRMKVMRHMLPGSNIGMITTRQQSQQGMPWALVGITRGLVESSAISNKTKEINYLFPLYQHLGRGLLLSTHEREHNLARSLTEKLAALLRISWQEDGRGAIATGGTFGPEDVLHYIYAQLHSPAYRYRYAEFLRMDFPRVFLTDNISLFSELCRLGADLVALHLLEDDYDAASWNTDKGRNPLNYPITVFIHSGGREVGKGQPKYDERRQQVFINTGSYFEGVPQEVWEFHIGGYQVCRKWLKDRGPKKGKPGRTLTEDDIAHYHKIVVALNETIRIMKEIDKVIEEHGGWPDAFVTDKSDLASREPSSQR